MNALVDTHCHLDFNAFDNDREAVLERAWNAGIIKILNPGVDLTSSHAAVSLAEKYPQVYAAVGVHPNDALTWDSGCLQELEDLASHPKVVAIGEIGLDYYRDRAPHELQRRILLEQLSLASDLDLPVVIHNREATADIIGVLENWKSDLSRSRSHIGNHPGVLHSYSGDPGSAMKAIGLGFYIGFTGPITFRKADDLRQVVTALPLESILIETDAPFLAPQKHRGARNEPAYVRYVAEQIADLHGVQLETAAQVTNTNAATLLKW